MGCPASSSRMPLTSSVRPRRRSGYSPSSSIEVSSTGIGWLAPSPSAECPSGTSASVRRSAPMSTDVARIGKYSMCSGGRVDPAPIAAGSRDGPLPRAGPQLLGADLVERDPRRAAGQQELAVGRVDRAEHRVELDVVVVAGQRLRPITLSRSFFFPLRRMRRPGRPTSLRGSLGRPCPGRDGRAGWAPGASACRSSRPGTRR